MLQESLLCWRWAITMPVEKHDGLQYDLYNTYVSTVQDAILQRKRWPQLFCVGSRVEHRSSTKHHSQMSQRAATTVLPNKTVLAPPPKEISTRTFFNDNSNKSSSSTSCMCPVSRLNHHLNPTLLCIVSRVEHRAITNDHPQRNVSTKYRGANQKRSVSGTVTAPPQKKDVPPSIMQPPPPSQGKDESHTIHQNASSSSTATRSAIIATSVIASLVVVVAVSAFLRDRWHQWHLDRYLYTIDDHGALEITNEPHVMADAKELHTSKRCVASKQPIIAFRRLSDCVSSHASDQQWLYSCARRDGSDSSSVSSLSSSSLSSSIFYGRTETNHRNLEYQESTEPNIERRSYTFWRPRHSCVMSLSIPCARR